LGLYFKAMVGQPFANWTHGAHVIMLNKQGFHNHTPRNKV
jgi:hypothetical protein